MKLTRAKRLQTWAEFQAVRTNGKSTGGKFVVLSASEAPNLRIGLITSKKAGGAVTRNLLRRRFREIIRKWGDSLLPDRHIVTIARYTAANANFAELEKDWIRQAQKLGLFSEQP